MLLALILGVFLIHAATGKECQAGNFELQKASVEGKFLSCPHLISDYTVKNVEACKALTCAKDGNAFNFGRGSGGKIGCFPKKCCGGYTYGNGNFDVYVYNEEDLGCATTVLADAPAVEVEAPSVVSDDEDDGEVTPEGCKFRSEVHPAGEVWVQRSSSGRTKECSCPDPLPDSWSAKKKCRGICQGSGGEEDHYQDEEYTKTKNGKEKTCTCNGVGKERCK